MRLINRNIKYIILLFLLQFLNTSNAQSNFRLEQYPVVPTLFLIPPNTIYLSDFNLSTTEKFITNLYLEDLTQTNLPVYLNIKIEGPNFTIYTNPNAVFTPIYLDGGFPKRLTNFDLSEYFDYNNLIFEGISKAAYEQKAGTSEGYYKICIQVYEYNTRLLISDPNIGCYSFFIVQNEPPILNIPEDNSTIQAQTIQNIFFQWTPRHLGSPNATFLTEYTFELVELWTDQLSPQAVFNSSIPLYTTTTTNTSLLYSMAEPLLIEGKKYAWRVQAAAANTENGSGYFNNNGYSQIFSFLYQTNCQAPFGVYAEAPNDNSVYISWTGQQEHQQYIIEYSAENSDVIYTATTDAEEFTLTNLAPNTNYVFRIAGNCQNSISNFTLEYQTKTLESGQTQEYHDYTCGMVPNSVAMQNQNPLAELKIGDKVTAGDFEVFITEVNGSGGVFSGKAYFRVPYLKSARVNLNFNNIKINDAYQLIDGFFESNYNPNDNLLWDIDATINIFASGSSEPTGTGSVTTDYTTTIDIPSTTENFNPNDYITYNPTTNTITVSSLPNGGGTTQTFPATEGRPNTITDANGEVYEVPTDNGNTPSVTFVGSNSGKTTPSGSGAYTSNDNATISNNVATATFTAFPNQRYGFDAYENIEALSSNYQTLNTNGGSPYFVAWKSITEKATDKVKVSIQNSNAINTDRIEFRNKEGFLYNAKSLGNSEFEITLLAPIHFDIQEVYCFYTNQEDATGAKDEVLGKINVCGYRPIYTELNIVDMSGLNYTTEEYKTALDNIYKQACFTYNVQLINDFNPSNWDVNNNGLDINDAEDRTQLTNEMKYLKTAFVNQYGQNQGYTIFLLPKSSQIGVTGFFPDKRDYGFVFIENNETVLHTIAHELGHGTGNLQHTWEQYNTNAGQTQNLLDYNHGEVLYKTQIDKIHNPGIQIIRDETEDNSNYFFTELDFSVFKNKDEITVSFLSKAETVISLPFNKIYRLNFSYGAVVGNTYEDLTFDPSVSTNLLYEFELYGNDNKTVSVYRWDYNSNAYILKKQGQVGDLEYTDINNGEAYIDNTNFNLVDGFVYPTLCSEGFVFYKFEKKQVEQYKEGTKESVKFLDLVVIPFSTNQRIGDKQINGGYNPYKFNCLWCADATTKAMLATHCQKPELILVDKIAQLRKVFPVSFDLFTDHFDNWENIELYCNSNDPSNGFPINCKPWEKTLTDDQTIRRLLIDNPIQFYKTFIQHFIDFQYINKIEAMSIIRDYYCALGDVELKKEYDIHSITNALNTLDPFSYRELDATCLYSLLSKLGYHSLTEGSMTNMPNGELAVINIINNVALNQIDGLIVYLEDGKNELDQTKYLWNQLFKKENNSFLFIGEDNKTNFVKALVKMYYKSKRYESSLAYIEYAQENKYGYLDSISYHFDYKNILLRLWHQCTYNFRSFENLVNLTYFNLNSSVYETTGQIKVVQQKTFGLFTADLPSNTRYYKIFDPVILTSSTNIGKLQDLKSSTDKIGIVPAIVLHYADQVATKRTTDDIIMTAIDLVALAIPPAQITKLRYLGKAFYYADKISSVASIAGTATRETNPEVSELLNLASAVTGVVSLGNLFGAQNITKVDEITKVPNYLGLGREECLKQIEELIDYINNKGNLIYLQKGQPEVLIELLSRESNALDIINNPATIKSIQTLRLISENLEVLTLLKNNIATLNKLSTKLLDYTPETLVQFAKDFANNPSILAKFNAQTNLVDAWENLLTSSLRLDIDWLRIVSNHMADGVRFEKVADGINVSKNGYQFGKIHGGKYEILHQGPYPIYLEKNKTVTIYGRLSGLDIGKDLDVAYGTHYFKWLISSKVGKNIGGMDVLIIDNWNWAKNHAWVKAAVERTKKGENVLISCTPFERKNLMNNIENISDGLTITGFEFAAMIHYGYGIDKATGLMRPLSELAPDPWWDKIYDFAKNNPQYKTYTKNALDDIDENFYNEIMNGSKEINRTEQEINNVMETFTFGYK